jgi:hypothetical protein
MHLGSAKPREVIRSRRFLTRSVKFEASAEAMLECFPIVRDVYGEQSRSPRRAITRAAKSVRY